MEIGLALLSNRLDNLDERGVLRMPGQTIARLYQERSPLYRKYADLTVSTAGTTPDQVATAILSHL
jgi:shikimate kinase